VQELALEEVLELLCGRHFLQASPILLPPRRREAVADGGEIEASSLAVVDCHR
jgi:hypothetical protein